MMRLAIALGVLLALWFGLKDMALRAYLAGGEPSLPAALTYSAPPHWATQPQSTPPGSWETPWGIDAFIVLPPADLAHAHGLIPAQNEESVSQALLALEQVSAAIPGDTPAYAPFYRTPSPANNSEMAAKMNALASADIMAAFEIYLAEANQGRGVLLVMAQSASPLAKPLIARMQAKDLASRFAGLVSFGPEETNAPEQVLTCADILQGACYQHVETKPSGNLMRVFLPNAGKRVQSLEVVDAQGVAAAIKIQAENVSTWLDETQPKLAEPFFTTTVIQNAPVFQPGGEEPLKPTSQNE